MRSGDAFPVTELDRTGESKCRVGTGLEALAGDRCVDFRPGKACLPRAEAERGKRSLAAAVGQQGKSQLRQHPAGKPILSHHQAFTEPRSVQIAALCHAASGPDWQVDLWIFMALSPAAFPLKCRQEIARQRSDDNRPSGKWIVPEIEMPGRNDLRYSTPARVRAAPRGSTGSHQFAGEFAMRIALVAAVFLASTIASAQAPDYHPAFRPAQFKGPQEGRANQVLVLGSIHLSGAPPQFRPAMLGPLLDRLAAWRPTAITTEDMSGLQCDALRRFPSRYAGTVKTYCSDPAPAARATGLDVPAANAEAERLLAAWPAEPRPGERRHLAAIFLAAGERNSALVQWLRLPASERRAGDGLDDELVTALTKLEERRNESGLIGAALAARLGLERVWSIDDHSADTPDDPDPVLRQAFGDALASAWNNPATNARMAEDARLEADLSRPDGILAMYRALNAPGQGELAYRSDFGAALAEPSPQQFGRLYVGYWETRNLRMVANIRDVLARYPGTRLLAIVGASHKPYFEAYLDQMHDVQLVDALSVLK